MIASTRLAALAVVGATLVLGACSGSFSGSDNEATTPTAPSEPAVVSVVVQPGVSEGFEGARNDIGDLDCAQDGQAWVVGGTVTNPLDAGVNYRIYTSFMDDGGSTLGLLQVDVDGVEPGATREWSGRLDVAAADLDCVLRVERTRLGS